MARDLSIGGLRERRLACGAGIDAADRFLLLHVRLIAAQSVAYQLEHAPSPANISKLVARSGGESLPSKCINFQPIKGWVKGMVVRSNSPFLPPPPPRGRECLSSLSGGTIFQNFALKWIVIVSIRFSPQSYLFRRRKKLPRNYLPIEIKAQIYFNRCAVEREAIDFSFPPFLDLHPLVLPWNIYSGNHEFLWFFVSSGAFNYYRENNVLRFLR